MKRITPLFLAGLVGLAACSDQTTAPLAPEESIAAVSGGSSSEHGIPN